MANRAAAGQLRRVARWLLGERGVLTLLTMIGFLVTVLVHPGQLYIDTRPDLYLDPGGLVRESLSTWVPGTGLGTTNYDNGYLPAAVVQWLLQAIGLPAWLAMRLWRFALLVTAAAGARRLLADLLRGRSSLGPGRGDALAGVTVAVCYAANPYVLIGASTTPVMLPYALFPWMLLAARRSFAEQRWWVGASWFALVMAAMGGMNAGVVLGFLLLAVPVLAWDAVSREGRTWRPVLRGTAACAVGMLVVSAYWIVGTATALSTATSVAAATEDPRTVAQVSSLAEVMRGLGSWLSYGGDALGPYRPGFTTYLTSPLMVLFSFTLPVLAVLGALLTRHPLARFATVLTVLGVVLMAGAYAPENPSPFGRALLFGFDRVPGLVAFRTTGKAGALAMLGMALLAALGARAALRRWPARAPWGIGFAGAGVALSVLPVWLGLIYPGVLSIPDYWTTAERQFASSSEVQRVWALPGETNALYRWRPRGVDDFAPYLLDREVVYGRSFPDGPLGAWNLLTSIDSSLGDGDDGALLSTTARYLAVGDVLDRNDMVWELMGAPRPLDVVSATEADPGLAPVALYGNAGENVSPLDPDRALPAEQRLSPLIRYRVLQPTSLARSFDTSGQLLVVGDNGSVAPSVWAGLLDGDTAYRLVADTSTADIAAALEGGGRLLLTDTNRRRSGNVHRLDLSGPLVSAGTPIADSRTFGGVDDQTVAVYDGIADVTASSSGSIFGPTPSGRPFLAVDGDPDTAWQFGDFGTAVGESLTVTLDRPTAIDRLSLLRSDDNGARVDSVVVRAGDQVVSGSFGDDDRLSLTFDEPATVDRVTVTVTGVTGRGANQVGLSEVGIPGVSAREYARLPVTLDDLATRADTAGLVAAAPIDVLLARDPDEQEKDLWREFSLPSGHDFRVRAQVTTTAPGQWRRCRSLGELDGRQLRARAIGPRPSATDGGPSVVQVRGCASVDLAAGTHRLVSRPGLRVDRLLLSAGGSRTPPATTNLSWKGGGTAYDVAVPESEQDRIVVLAVARDPRWQAELDGRPLGPPVEVNGYAMGWMVPAGESGDLRIRFAPQRRFLVAAVLSGLGVLAAVLVLGLSRRRGRRDESPPGEQPAPEGPRAAAATRRRAALEVGLMVAAWLLGGWLGLACAVAAVGAVRLGLEVRWLSVAALTGMLLVPLAWLGGNLSRLGEVSFAVVSLNPWPQRLAVPTLVLLLAGVLLRPDAGAHPQRRPDEHGRDELS
ncbi:alpha-(1-_3)-arabinofuranosyltransferase family protein [Nocardioides sp.]|uniref:alpha-(1->3)-arabinofuranosyltransferase domain-containing protein n=1 Tax=Nocardioides sp. TaxID=35761 RepID=UPI0035279C0B